MTLKTKYNIEIGAIYDSDRNLMQITHIGYDERVYYNYLDKSHISENYFGYDLPIGRFTQMLRQAGYRHLGIYPIIKNTKDIPEAIRVLYT